MARAWKSWTLVLSLLMATLLAGCTGGGDPDLGGDGSTTGIEPGNGLGRIEGRVFTVDLDIVTDARVSLVEDGELVQATRSDEEGRFVLEDLEPGTYRVQVTAVCCREHVQAVEVVEQESTRVDVQLAPFTADDLQEGYVREFQWTGFMSCGAAMVALSGDVCADVDDDSETAFSFELGPGIKTVTATLVWDAPGVTGDEMILGLARDPCADPTICEVPTDFYGEDTGTSPLHLRIDGGSPLSFDGIEEPIPVQWRVFPPFFTVDVYYNLQFTVYYHLHYHDPAPEGYDPLPDQ